MTQPRNRRALLTLAVVAAMLALMPRVSFSQQQREGRPNVLFIAIDDLNDWIGCLDGHPDVKTPNIDRLARRGVLFTRAYASATVCNPSRTSLLTGILPSRSGVYANAEPFRLALPAAVTIPQHFMAHGYHVVRGGKIFHVPGDPASWDRPRNAPYHGSNLRERDPKAFEPIYTVRPAGRANLRWGPLRVSDEDMSDTQIVNWAVEYLNMKHDKPLFLACGLFKPHTPWHVPQKYFDMYPPDGITVPELVENDLDDVAGMDQDAAERFHKAMTADGNWRAAVAAYLACVSFTDANVGRLLDGLDRSPYADNTIIVLWSDHGYKLGDHYGWGKGTLWERDAHVPLIIAGPPIPKPGVECHRTVSLIDIYPTLVELCGLSLPPRLDGTSLVPLLNDPTAPWDHPALTTNGRNNHGVRSERWHYMRDNDGNEQLYDHENDPHEWTNLANKPEYDSVKEKLASCLPKVNAEYPVPYGRNVAPATEKAWGAYFAVDLREHCNRTFKDDVAGDRQGGWTDRGRDDMRNLPVGSILLLGVPFRIIDPRDTVGPGPQKSCIVLRGAEGGSCFPKAVASIGVNKTAAELVFLHCSVGDAGLEHGEELAEYVIAYEDGSKIEVPLKYNENIGDWIVRRNLRSEEHTSELHHIPLSRMPSSA